MVKAGRLGYGFAIISLVMVLASCGSPGSNGLLSTKQTTSAPSAPSQPGTPIPPSSPPPPPPQDPPPAFACPVGTQDMVSWMMPSDMSVHIEGNNDYKAFYIRPGKMYFTKNKRGWPLDEKLYDENYVYDYITENGTDGWFDPSDVKEFVTPVKLAPRCVPVGAPGQKVAAVTNTQTQFVSKMSCAVVSRSQLGTVVGEVWNQGLHDFGLLDVHGQPIGPVDTRVLTYRWSCDSNFSNCKVREELWLARGYGWVEWKNYVLQNGIYVLHQDTIGTHAATGAPVPFQPCGDARVQ